MPRKYVMPISVKIEVDSFENFKALLTEVSTKFHHDVLKAESTKTLEDVVLYRLELDMVIASSCEDVSAFSSDMVKSFNELSGDKKIIFSAGVIPDVINLILDNKPQVAHLDLSSCKTSLVQESLCKFLDGNVEIISLSVHEATNDIMGAASNSSLVNLNFSSSQSVSGNGVITVNGIGADQYDTCLEMFEKFKSTQEVAMDSTVVSVSTSSVLSERAEKQFTIKESSFLYSSLSKFVAFVYNMSTEGEYTCMHAVALSVAEMLEGEGGAVLEKAQKLTIQLPEPKLSIVVTGNAEEAPHVVELDSAHIAKALDTKSFDAATMTDSHAPQANAKLTQTDIHYYSSTSTQVDQDVCVNVHIPQSRSFWTQIQSSSVNVTTPKVLAFFTNPYETTLSLVFGKRDVEVKNLGDTCHLDCGEDVL